MSITLSCVKELCLVQLLHTSIKFSCCLSRLWKQVKRIMERLLGRRPKQPLTLLLSRVQWQVVQRNSLLLVPCNCSDGPCLGLANFSNSVCLLVGPMSVVAVKDLCPGEDLKYSCFTYQSQLCLCTDMHICNAYTIGAGGNGLAALSSMHQPTSDDTRY